MTRRTVKVTMNDPHGGHRYGLMNPAVTLKREDELGMIQPYQPEPTASQTYLWNLYQDLVNQVAEIAAGDEILVSLNGDATQGNKHPAAWVSTRIADQITIAAANMAPWYALPNLKHVQVSRGTGAHNLGEGSSEYILTELLSARYPNVDTRISGHWLLDYNGVVFDVAHHGPGPGNRNWLHGNVARFYLRDLMLRDILAHRRPPDVVERAHVHVPVYEYLETGGYTSRIVITPSMCMVDDYAEQAGRSPDSVTNGITVYEIVDGQITGFHRLYATTDIRTKESL